MTTPNYKPGIGALVTDRFDFQKHVDGYSFRHKADQIDLYPTVVINSETKSTVQEAIAKLSELAAPPSVPDATVSVKGILRINGDIAGTANGVRVTRLQNRNISSLAPTNGQVLTWNTSANNWEPQAPVAPFAAAGDLAGSSATQTVIGLTGTAGIVRASCNQIIFEATKFPIIAQTAGTSGPAKDFNIIAQSTNVGGQPGGIVLISGGSGGAAADAGGVALEVNDSGSVLLHVTQFANGNRVSALNGPVDSSKMPAGTGDMVTYINDAVTAPTSGNPVDGAILYSSGGKLYVKQADGTNFALGTLPDPFVWGSDGYQHIIERANTTSTTNAAVTLYSYAIPINTSIYVEAVFVGKLSGTTDTYQRTVKAGYTREGGAAVAVGTTTPIDSRGTAAGSAWTVVPTVDLSGNSIVFSSGGNATTIINWLMVAELTIILS